MNRSWGALPLAGALRQGFQLALLASLLAGCGMFGSGSGDSAPAAQDAGNQPYPNLGTVPMQAPVPTPATERNAIQAGLVADQESAASGAEQPAPGMPPAPAQTMTEAQPQQTAGLSTQTLPLPQPPMIAAPGTPFYANPSAPLPKVGGRELLYPAPYAPFLAGAAAPGYTSGYAANASGLPAAGQPLAVIFFAEGSAALSGQDMAVLGNVAQIQKQRGGRLRLVGHASERVGAAGDQEAANQQISLARAQAVAGALVQLGMAQDSLSVVAVGSQLPVNPETTAAGEAGNRRVEVFLVP